MKPSDFERFWSKVKRLDDDSCWLWMGGVDKDGYGKFSYRVGGKARHARAHRVAVKEFNKSKVVRHTCDNPPCCNPHHLTSGSQLDNRRDCVRRGRQASSKNDNHVWKRRPSSMGNGEKSHLCKLTDEQVAEIRKRYVPRKGVGALAREYGVAIQTISRIAIGKYRPFKTGEWQHSTSQHSASQQKNSQQITERLGRSRVAMVEIEKSLRRLRAMSLGDRQRFLNEIESLAQSAADLCARLE